MPVVKSASKRARLQHGADSGLGSVNRRRDVLALLESALLDVVLRLLGALEWHRLLFTCCTLGHALDFSRIGALAVAALRNISPSETFAVALRASSAQCVALMLSNAASLNRETRRAAVRELIAQDDGEGGGALHAAAMGGDPEVAKLLLASGASMPRHLDRTNSHGETPVFLASLFGHTSVLKLLLQASADPGNKSQAHGCVALHPAAHSFQVEAVQLLLQHRADVNTRTSVSGHTPIMQACWAPKSLEMVDLLLEARADVSVTDARGFSVLDYPLPFSTRLAEDSTPYTPYRKLITERLQAAGARHSGQKVPAIGLPPPMPVALMVRRSELLQYRKRYPRQC